MQNIPLYVVGNGFDLYHRFPTKFKNFKDYLFQNDSELHDYVEEFLPVSEDWCDLEISLAHLDVSNIIDEAMTFLQPYSAEDWSDSYHHDYQYEIDKIVTALSDRLLSEFTSWIESIEIYDNDLFDYLNLDSQGLFLTFNYTPTLETIYEIDEDNILYIHGEARNEESDIVLGHAWNPVEAPSLNQNIDPESFDTRVLKEMNSLMIISAKHTNHQIA